MTPVIYRVLFNIMRISVLIILGLCLSQQDRFVEIEGHRFRIREYGQGEVTVVFESGMFDEIEKWESIPDSVAQVAKVFLYDRAGLGQSDPSPLERTIPNMVYELHSILEKEKIGPPYVLVGHSLGGFITRYFADRYPGEVKGLLLLDPAPEAWWDGMSEQELAAYKQGGDSVFSTRPETLKREWEQLLPNREYMRDISIPDEIPVIMVSCSEWNWFRFHKKQIRKHRDARHVELEGGHYIHIDNPEVIISYIKELVEE